MVIIYNLYYNVKRHRKNKMICVIKWPGKSVGFIYISIGIYEMQFGNTVVM